MILFFSLLVCIALALFGTSFYYIFIAKDLLMHFYFGLIGTVAILITHCWVFFYFIGTGEGIREGIIEFKLDPSAIKRTKKFKARTFPFALFSMIFMIVAVVLGGALRFAKVGPAWHYGFVYFALLFNFFSFRQEFNAISENEKLMGSLNEAVESGRV